MIDVRKKLYEEILEYVHRNDALYAAYPSLKKDAKEIVRMQCYRTLRKIKSSVENERLDDKACVWRVESIVEALEEIGSDGGFRHDF